MNQRGERITHGPHAGRIICPQCGKHLRTMVTCSDCGVERCFVCMKIVLPSGEWFCRECVRGPSKGGA